METKHSRPLTYRIYEELKQHVGEDNAIHGKDLAEMFGIDRRTVRTYIKEIRRSGELERHISSTNRGYFVTTKEEYKPKDNSRIRLALSILKTEYEQDKKAQKDGQGKISMGEYYKPYFEAFMNTSE